MNFREYQQAALETDQAPGTGEKSLAIPLFGLAGEAGSLLTEYKKLLRDGPAYRLFDERIAEEIGDILWYLANIASKAGLDLQEVAASNLHKVRSRWQQPDKSATGPTFLDDGFAEAEQLPRRFDMSISEDKTQDPPRVRVSMGGQQLGATLTDNAYKDDGYRFHDVLHFSFAAVLGWSPVTRALMKRKRKSDTRIDEIEDGGRAVVIEEGIAALAFDYAKRHSFLRDVQAVDYSLLRTIKSLTEHLEVSNRSLYLWEQALLQGFAVWREIVKNDGGHVIGDLTQHSVSFRPPEPA